MKHGWEAQKTLPFGMEGRPLSNRWSSGKFVSRFLSGLRLSAKFVKLVSEALSGPDIARMTQTHQLLLALWLAPPQFWSS